MKIKEKIIVKIKYYEYEFDEIKDAINYAKKSIKHGYEIEPNDVKINITFSEESEVKEKGEKNG